MQDLSRYREFNAEWSNGTTRGSLLQMVLGSLVNRKMLNSKLKLKKECGKETGWESNPGCWQRTTLMDINLKEIKQLMLTF